MFEALLFNVKCFQYILKVWPKLLNQYYFKKIIKLFMRFHFSQNKVVIILLNRKFLDLIYEINYFTQKFIT